jgi:hypothetical protein
MAIAVARLLGYELGENFAFPYLSASIADFWRRWHISLSTWLRDYLYFPLGGNRGSTLFTYRNLMLTMLLGGLWHGASWTFVLWGGLHGTALIAHRLWQRFANLRPRLHWFVGWIAVPLTFYWVLIAWVPFRAGDVYADAKSGQLLRFMGGGFKDLKGDQYIYLPGALERDAFTKDWFTPHGLGIGEPSVKRVSSGLGSSLVILKAIVLQRSVGEQQTAGPGLFAVLALLAFMHWLNARRVFADCVRPLPDWAFAALLGVGWALALFMKPMVYSPFIYFQF